LLLKAFEYISKLDYDFEPSTYDIITKNFHNIYRVDNKLLQSVFLEILSGKHIKKAIDMLHQLKFFDHCFQFISHIDQNNFNTLVKYNINIFNSSKLEMFAILFLNNEVIKNDFLNNQDEINVNWLLKNIELIKSDNIQNELFNASKHQAIKNIHIFKMLLRHLCNIYENAFDVSTKDANDLMFLLLSKPYLPEQIIIPEQFNDIKNKAELKEKILYHLINNQFMNNETYESFVEQLVNQK